MTTRLIAWTIEVADLDTALRVGIWEHERDLQPIRVSFSIRALAPAFPATIDDCLNYEPICRWIIDAWPVFPHTPLLETKMRELLEHIFDYDPRVEWVDLAIVKPKAIPGVRGVGIRMALSRHEFEAAFRVTAVTAYTGDRALRLAKPVHR